MSAVEIETESEGVGAATVGVDGDGADPTSSEPTVTLHEVYQQMQDDARQAQAIAARSAGALERCSYDAGYHTQPVYWCRTCHADHPLGVCFGCSMNCHLDHQVEELFEKRAFRCDCGNATAGGCCSLQPSKDEVNADNQYNHNFKGQYCRCRGTYVPHKDVMFQCVLCQDWLHDRCVTTGVRPASDEGGEDFICRECLAKPQHDILLPYLDQAVTEAAAAGVEGTPSLSRSVSLGTPVRADSTVASASVAPALVEESKEEAKPDAQQEDSAAPPVSEALATPSRKRKAEEAELSSPTADATSSASTTAVTSASAASGLAATPSRTSSVACTRPSRVAAAAPSNVSAAAASSVALLAAVAAVPADRFVPSDWNQLLCACAACTGEYRTRGLLWLLDEEEEAQPGTDGAAAGARSALVAPSVLADMSESDAAAPVSSAFDVDSMTAGFVSRLPRTQAIDILTPFQLFQESIARQLQLFAARCPGVVVTSEIMKQITEEAKAESKASFQQLKRARMSGEETLPE